MKKSQAWCCLVTLACSVTVSSAYALQCAQPEWTAAIRDAMGRAPQAGECNTQLYPAVKTHAQRVRSVQETLGPIYAAHPAVAAQATQKLPLRRSRPARDAGLALAQN